MKLPSAARWAELTPHLDALLALDAGERSRRLDALRAGDPGLADELGGLLQGLAASPTLSFLDRSAPPALPPERGERIGAWTLAGLLGEGGMGSVWRARRTDGRFEGEAAIKLLKNGLFDATAQERFRREGAILARLQHPGIARLLDAGVTPGGHPYLVLELVHGQPIDRWCHARRLGARACVALFDGILAAVAAAHAQLVIHRDLKPSNILVDDAGQVHLLDFGIARLQDESAEPALTRAGGLVLTPRYAAPEQFDGRALSVATDVYALGILLYELLAGVHPSGLPPDAGALAYFKAAADGHFEAASVRSGRRELRGDLDNVLAKALAREPAERYATVSALQADLRRVLHHEPIEARPAGLFYRARKLLRRRPLESAAVLAVVVAIPAGAHLQAAVLASMAAGTGAALWQLRRANRQAAMARAEQQRAEEVKQFVASIFEQARPRSGAGGVVTAGDLLRVASERITAELSGQPRVAAELTSMVGAGFMSLGDVPAARQVLPDAVARCEQAFGRLHPTTLKARCLEIVAHNTAGDLEASERLLPPLVAELRAAMPAMAREVVVALRGRSFVRTKRGDADGAISDLREAWRIAQQQLGPSDDDTLDTGGLLGNTLDTFFRSGEALQVLEATVALAREVHGANRPHVLLARLESQHASALGSSGRHLEAVAALRQVVQDQLSLDGIETDRLRFSRFELAIALVQSGSVDEGVALMRETIALDARLFAEPTVDSATMQGNLGWALAEAGHGEEALAALDRAEALMARAGGGNAGFANARRLYRASACLLTGGAAEALTIADALLAVEAVGSSINMRLGALRLRTAALRLLGRLAEADGQAAALRAAMAADGATPLVRARVLLELAALHAAQGRTGEAAADARGAIALLENLQVPEAPLRRRAEALLAQCGAAAAAC